MANQTCCVRIATEEDIRAQVSAASPFELVKNWQNVSIGGEYKAGEALQAAASATAAIGGSGQHGGPAGGL